MDMPFGQYKGHDIEDLPSSYLRWLASKCDKENICKAADDELKYRAKNDLHHEDEP